MKRTFKKLTGFVLSLALFSQILVSGAYFEGTYAAETAGTGTVAAVDYSEEAAADQSTVSDVAESILNQDTFATVYDYFDTEYDYGETDYGYYTLDKEGRLLRMDSVPEGGILPEGIKIIDQDFWCLRNAQTLIFPDGLEELVIKGNASQITFPSTLKKLTVKSLKNIETLTLPEGLEELTLDIAYGAWEDPGKLNTINLPSSLKKLTIDSFWDVELKGNDKFKIETGENGEKYYNSTLIYVPGQATEVKIKEGTVSIGKGVLSGNSYVTSVEIPDTVTSIGDWAFGGTYGLKSVKLPAGLKEIGPYAFAYAGLESVEIPKGVTKIKEGTFWHAGSLQSVKMLGKVTEIGDMAFQENYYLYSINIPKTVKKIGDYAFLEAFSYGEKNGSIVIPASTVSIGRKAFADTYKLTKVTLNKGLKTLGDYAFSYCGFNSLTLPATLKNVGANVFTGTNGNVKVAKGSKYVKAYKNGIYTNKYSRLIAFSKKLTSIKFHKKCKTIDEGLFQNTNLKSVSLPASLEKIGFVAFYGSKNLKKITIGKGTKSLDDTAFAGCPALQTIEVNKGNRNYSSYKGCLYNKKKTEIIVIPWGQKKVQMYESVKTVNYSILSGRYFVADDPGIQITLPKNISADNITPLTERYVNQYNGKVKLLVNVGSKTASSIAEKNAQNKKAAEESSWKTYIPINYRFIESDKKILEAIKPKSTKIKVKSGASAALDIGLPAGLEQVAEFVNDTNTECKITWSINDPTIMIPNPDGSIQGLNKGKASLKATVEMKSGKKRTIEFTVTVE